MKKILCLFVFILLIVVLAGCVEYDIKDVQATVSDKVYKHSYYTYYRADDPTYTYSYSGSGKYRTRHTTVHHHYHTHSVYHPARYLVYLKYEELSTYTNDHGLYDSIKVGDTLKASLHEGYDEKGKRVSRSLSTWVPSTEDKSRNKIKKMNY